VITTVLLFHALQVLADPCAVRLWQQELAGRHGVCGRIVVSPQGLHAVVGGDAEQLDRYAAATREHPAFADLRCHLVQGQVDERPGLRVTLQEELVPFGAAGELQLGAQGVVGGGARLDPAAVHDLVARHGSEVVFLDGRNRYAAEVGRFRGAVVPDVNAARDFVRELESGRLDALKQRRVVTYCASGLRSEILSSLMLNRGFGEVYSLDGGIVSYTADVAGDGLWEGTLYVLGDRVQILVGDQPAVLGRCESCSASTCSYRDCVAPQCRNRPLLCNGCADFGLCGAHRN